MNFELTEDQSSIVLGLEQLIDSFAIEAPKGAEFAPYAGELDAALAESGYIDISREEGLGAIDAALIVERLARLPQTVEVAASALIAPALGIEPGWHPIAVARQSGTEPIIARFLPMATMLLLDRGDDAVAVALEPGRVQAVETLFAYPYGRLDDIVGFEARSIDCRVLRRRWRLAIAVEAAGLMAAAIDLVVEHLTTRRAFGRLLGSFQAIQHRMAMAAETAHAARWLALRAAWSDTEADAAIAAGFVQDRIPGLTYDLQQFCGAMGLTLEFPLHFWTYRLRALLGELGGSSEQARCAADATWPEDA